MLFYSDDPVRDFERWDAYCQKENQRIRYDRELKVLGEPEEEDYNEI